MASYDEIKQRLMEEDDNTPAEFTTTTTTPARPRSTSSGGVNRILLGGLAIALVFGILFGVPAYVDSRQPEKSKLVNRTDAARWVLSFFDRKGKKKGRRRRRGPLGSAFK